MKLLGQILLVCVLISALQALAAVIVIALMLALVWGLIYRTRETVGLLMVCLLIEALQVHPVVTIGLVVLLGGGVWLADRKKRDQQPDQTGRTLLLPPPTSKMGED